MLTIRSLPIAGIVALALSTAAHAQTFQDKSRWFVHAGPAEVVIEPSATVYAAGSAIPGAKVSIPNQWTVEVEAGYFATPHLALAFAGGYPPTATVNAGGSLAALGRAGQMTYGPSTFNAQWHFNRGGVVQPYVGAGVTMMLVFSTKDGSVTNLKVANSVGQDVQIGADFMVNEHWGAYVDAKQAFLGTTATGNLGPAPIRANVTLNPAVFNAGVVYRF
jgi:outer membrane protein